MSAVTQIQKTNTKELIMSSKIATHKRVSRVKFADSSLESAISKKWKYPKKWKFLGNS